MQYFLYWLFHGKIPFNEYDDDDVYMGDVEYIVAARLWIFGELNEIPKLQNIAMRQLHVCKSHSDFAPDFVDRIFGETADGSLLQRFMAHEAALTWTSTELLRYPQLLHLVMEQYSQYSEEDQAGALRFMVNGEE